MSELRSVDIQEVLALAGDALSKISVDVVRLDDVEVLSDEDRRNFIARAVAHYHDGNTRRVILKSTRSPTYDHTAENVPQISGLAKEWVACALLAAHAHDRGHGSTLLAGDVANGIMVFEDLGAGLTLLVDPLLNESAEDAEHALKLYATALGRLHSDTADCRDAHHEMFQPIFGSGRSCGQAGWRVEEEAQRVANMIGSFRISEQGYYRSRRDYGGLKLDQRRRISASSSRSHSAQEWPLRLFRTIIGSSKYRSFTWVYSYLKEILDVIGRPASIPWPVNKARLPRPAAPRPSIAFLRSAG
jgi:hypothetical protein